MLQYSVDEPDSPLTGFPLCSYLTGKKAQIGRNARMLAAQSLERMADGCQVKDLILLHPISHSFSAAERFSLLACCVASDVEGCSGIRAR